MPFTNKQIEMAHMLKMISKKTPELLPQIYVHSDLSWLTGGDNDAYVSDTNGALHMCETDFRALKRYGAPTILIMEVIDNGVSIHEFDFPKVEASTCQDPALPVKKKADANMNIWGADVLQEKRDGGGFSRERKTEDD